MIKVITYGTYDHLHYGHIRLLERAKALGDYLIVGVTSDDFDKTRGKINVQQSLEDRIAAVKSTGLADKVIVEEYEGQKINDIRKYNVDIFTIGSDWAGFFDYLNEYCNVVYLPRTQGISSSEIRSADSNIKLGLVGYSSFLNKFYKESKYVNFIKVVSLCSSDCSKLTDLANSVEFVTDNFSECLNHVDAVYIHSHPNLHYEQCKQAILRGKHVLCESPIAKTEQQCSELLDLAKINNVILVEAIRTAYLTAYSRMLLLLKGGIIGRVTSIDAVCTSLSTYGNFGNNSLKWGAFEAWGPTALLPVFQILGVNYSSMRYFSIPSMEMAEVDGFTKVDMDYEDAVATIKVGTSVKSESSLIISGSKGYVYVPAPWWKTEYFEVRYEDSNLNRKYFYQVDGEGIRYELVQFAMAINDKRPDYYISRTISKEIAQMVGKISLHNK